jgi:hypothetical protein
MAAAAFGGRVILSSLLADFAVCAGQAATAALQVPNRRWGTRGGL